MQNLPELQSFDFLHLLGPKAFYNSSHFFLSFEISHPGNLLLQWPVLSQILPVKQSASALHLNFPKMFKSSVQSLVTLSEQGNFSPFGIAAHCPLGVQYLPALQSFESSQTPSPPLFLASSQSLVLLSEHAGRKYSGGYSLHFPLKHYLPNEQWASF